MTSTASRDDGHTGGPTVNSILDSLPADDDAERIQSADFHHALRH
jgi:hypothetical protein